MDELGSEAMGASASRLIDPLDVRLEHADVVGFLDYPAGREPPERIARLLREMLAEARQLVAARGAYRRIEPAESRSIGLDPLSAEGLVIGLVTAGPAIERRSSELLATGELTRAVLLDAAGSAAAEEAADRMGELIGRAHDTPAPGPHTARQASSKAGVAEARPPTPQGHSRISCRLSPGYGRWTLRWQRELFARLPHEQLGVELTETCLMVPHKSISFAMWLGAREPVAQGIGGCDRCTLSRCRYRRLSRPESRGSADALPTQARGPHRSGDGA